MTYRLTAFALAALVGGITALLVVDGRVGTVLGFTLVVPGAALCTVAVLRGITPTTAAPTRAAEAESHATATRSEATTRVVSTNRWTAGAGG